MPTDLLTPLLQHRAEMIARQLMEDLAADNGGPVWLLCRGKPGAEAFAGFTYHAVLTAVLLKDAQRGADLAELEGAQDLDGARWSLAAGGADEPDTRRIVRRWPFTNFALSVFF